ncbi:unnamed protein product [Gongylonema pulchrum]|uniref:Uncharacterized protein n=1 Tax=Gongylonema pulchrum TaxID=637853 RepID=A0A3P7N3T5_9BILA|nr:unnamed protein product [Gongylonema pulchrum]
MEGFVSVLKRCRTEKIICCYEVRDIGEPAIAQQRFLELITGHFDVSVVPDSELDEQYSSPDIKVLNLIPNGIVFVYFRACLKGWSKLLVRNLRIRLKQSLDDPTLDPLYRDLQPHIQLQNKLCLEGGVDHQLEILVLFVQ